MCSAQTHLLSLSRQGVLDSKLNERLSLPMNRVPSFLPPLSPPPPIPMPPPVPPPVPATLRPIPESLSRFLALTPFRHRRFLSTLCGATSDATASSTATPSLKMKAGCDCSAGISPLPQSSSLSSLSSALGAACRRFVFLAFCFLRVRTCGVIT